MATSKKNQVQTCAFVLLESSSQMDTLIHGMTHITMIIGVDETLKDSSHGHFSAHIVDLGNH